jgi:hypothetical protein
MAQGYFLSKPLTAKDVPTWIHSSARAIAVPEQTELRRVV